MVNTYPLNTEIVLTGDFTQVMGGAPVDPTNITLILTNPSAVTQTLVYPGAITRVSTGVYTYAFAPNQVGSWTYEWQGMGAVEAMSFLYSFIVAASNPGGTYAFQPPIGEFIAYAYGMIGVRRTAILQQHMMDARMGLNLMFSEWANRGVNLWEIKQSSTALVQGVATYNAPNNCSMILDDATIQTNPGTTNQNDRVITQVSREEWSAQPNKLLQGPPTIFWYNRLTPAAALTLWPVPDGNGPYLLNYYYVSQMQDAAAPSGQTADVPYLWYRAMASGLAAELCPLYAPARETVRRADAERSFQIAAEWNTENVSVMLAPQLAGYYR